ncbi:MAG: hypothetical protein R2828_30015 [Saprospiraceae bacterium]
MRIEDGGQEGMLVIPGAGVVSDEIEIVAARFVGVEAELEVGGEEVVVGILVGVDVFVKEECLGKR